MCADVEVDEMPKWYISAFASILPWTLTTYLDQITFKAWLTKTGDQSISVRYIRFCPRQINTHDTRPFKLDCQLELKYFWVIYLIYVHSLIRRSVGVFPALCCHWQLCSLTPFYGSGVRTERSRNLTILELMTRIIDIYLPELEVMCAHQSRTQKSLPLLSQITKKSSKPLHFRSLQFFFKMSEALNRLSKTEDRFSSNCLTNELTYVAAVFTGLFLITIEFQKGIYFLSLQADEPQNVDLHFCSNYFLAPRAVDHIKSDWWHFNTGDLWDDP